MSKLKITIFGNATELLIGTFPKAGADWVLGFCKEFKPMDIEEVWYDECFFPKEWAKGKDWDSLDDVFHGFGFRPGATGPGLAITHFIEQDRVASIKRLTQISSVGSGGQVLQSHNS
jgi:hypothetical protein